MAQYDDETLRKLQAVELDILKDVDALCRKHSLTYFLDSGTALGAVRHGGFIPWDDDIDLGMPREDYDRFLEIAPRELGERYYLSEPVTNPKQSALFAKIWLVDTKFYTDETLRAGIEQGIGIDVFPYDVLSADEDVAARQIKKCATIQRVMYLYHSASVVVPHKGVLGALEKGACCIAHALLKVFCSRERLLREFFASSLAGRENPGEGMFCAPYALCGSYPREALLPVQDMPFEDTVFPVPSDVESYLDVMYGDWRTLPPEEKRRQHKPVVLEFAPED